MKLAAVEVINRAISRGLVLEVAPSNIKQAVRFLAEQGERVVKLSKNQYEVGK